MKFSLAAALALLIVSCAKQPTDSPSPAATTPTTPESNMKAIVVVFSATGITRGVAERLASVTGSDYFELKPAQPYTAADLDWTNKQSRSSVEMNDMSCRPAIAEMPANLADYDTIFVGFPIWWYREPSIIDTFIESNAEALAGKTIVPFATSGGSGMGDSSANLQRLAPAAKVAEGRRFAASVSADDLAAWAKQF